MYKLRIDGKEYDSEGTIQSFVSSLGKKVDSYLYLITGVPVPMDTIPEDGSMVDAIRVASGG